jgi:hypothetical protein
MVLSRTAPIAAALREKWRLEEREALLDEREARLLAVVQAGAVASAWSGLLTDEHLAEAIHRAVLSGVGRLSADDWRRVLAPVLRELDDPS